MKRKELDLILFKEKFLHDDIYMERHIYEELEKKKQEEKVTPVVPSEPTKPKRKKRRMYRGF